MALSKPTNGVNSDYANRIGLLFDAFNNGNYAFPATQVPSADANTLDDYEEGTWTPTIAFGGASVGITYSSQGASYTKIGDRVLFSGLLVMSANGSSTGSATLAGLPFACRNNANAQTAASVRFGVITFTGQYVGYINQSASAISFLQTVEAGTLSALTEANFAATSQVVFSGQYPV